MQFRISAPAKVNLSLHVTGKRQDGYHLLDSLVAFTAFGDQLDISHSDECRLEITGPFAYELAGDNTHNLVLKAAQLLRQHAGVKDGAHILLHKHIPVGAGLGGGSADAAATLRGLCSFWNLEFTDEILYLIATQLGSDVPVCLRSQTARMRGVGEHLQPFHYSGAGWLVLVNPRLPLLTKDVFSHFSGKFSIPAEISDSASSLGALVHILKQLDNDLEKPAIALLPVIADILAVLKTTQNCRLARMSGSGATCFGLYATAEDASAALATVKAEYADWWAVASEIKAA